MILIEIGPYHNGMEQEISYQFAPEVWGQGTLESILAETQKKNIRSCRLLEALGFKMRESLIRFRQPQVVYMKRLCKSIKASKAFNEMLE